MRCGRRPREPTAKVSYQHLLKRGHSGGMRSIWWIRHTTCIGRVGSVSSLLADIVVLRQPFLFLALSHPFALYLVILCMVSFCAKACIASHGELWRDPRLSMFLLHSIWHKSAPEKCCLRPFHLRALAHPCDILLCSCHAPAACSHCCPCSPTAAAHTCMSHAHQCLLPSHPVRTYLRFTAILK